MPAPFRAWYAAGRTWPCYLAHDCSVAATAGALYIHRNTLRKRLARIEQILRIDLSRVDDLVEAYLRMQAAEMLVIRASIEDPQPSSHRRDSPPHRG